MTALDPSSYGSPDLEMWEKFKSNLPVCPGCSSFSIRPFSKLITTEQKSNKGEETVHKI